MFTRRNILSKISDTIQTKASIEIHVSDYLAAYSIIILTPVDTNQSEYCHARILPFRKDALRAPMIKPDLEVDPFWHDFIHSQFRSMWESSRNVPIKDVTENIVLDEINH